MLSFGSKSTIGGITIFQVGVTFNVFNVVEIFSYDFSYFSPFVKSFFTCWDFMLEVGSWFYIKKKLKRFFDIVCFKIQEFNEVSVSVYWSITKRVKFSLNLGTKSFLFRLFIIMENWISFLILFLQKFLSKTFLILFFQKNIEDFQNICQENWILLPKFLLF
jgi:hypothetical protein